MKDQFKINRMGSEVSSIKKAKTRISKVMFIWFFAGTATMSLAMVILFWHTSVFQNAIVSRLVLKNGTQAFAWWEKPPVSPLIRVRIFNYTNVEDYEFGKAGKLHVEEVGPYIYRETLTRVNAKLNENGTITYQEKTTHEREGGRSDNEMIRVPNVPLIAAVQKAKEINAYLHFGVTFALTMVGVEPFKLLTVKEYLWGYTDDLLKPALKLLSITESVPYDKFGMLMARARLSPSLTIHTGSDDIDNVGLLQSVNGMESRNIWKEKECDEVGGTDGSMFPPNLIQDRNATIAIYARDMCRKFPMRFHGDGTSFDIPTLRYKPATDIFTYSNTTNSCFCQKSSEEGNSQKIETCPPAGIFNMSRCTYGLPLLVSFPHFYNGEKILQNHVQGLNPRQELHESYADIHPRIGVLMGGWSRFQINAQVNVLETVPVLGKLQDGMILPLLWFEIGVDKIPESILSTLREAYYTVGTLESVLQWGSLLCTILSMCAMAFMMKKHREIDWPKWQNNVSLKTGC